MTFLVIRNAVDAKVNKIKTKRTPYRTNVHSGVKNTNTLDKSDTSATSSPFNRKCNNTTNKSEREAISKHHSPQNFIQEKSWSDIRSRNSKKEEKEAASEEKNDDVLITVKRKARFDTQSATRAHKGSTKGMMTRDLFVEEKDG